MQLWNDYEGKTIADAYPLGKLLRPEGRSAFFATSNGTGIPAVIRLTEALNDEHEMLERWRLASGVHQENLVEIRKYGQTTFEGTPLAYAVMELTDAGLEDVLKERPLTYAETTQIATSVLAGLTALHENGLVHEHVGPASVLAAGEVVKLRSDCVRECPAAPEGGPSAEGQELKQKDVHDLALLLLRCLTLEKKLTPAILLPAPFQQIVANGVSGVWGLPEIAAALNPHNPKPLVPESVLPREATSLPIERAGTSPGTADRPVNASARPIQLPLVSAAATLTQPSPRQTTVQTAPEAKTIRSTEPGAVYSHLRTHDEQETASRPWRLWAACAAAILIAFVAWAIIHRNSASQPIQTLATVPESNTPSSQPAPTAAAPTLAAPSAADTATVAAAPLRSGWYVVAYTYNHREQALAKVATIRKRHDSLHPAVFSPGGHAPFLVTLGGGPMSREQAFALKDRARRDGLPRDTFARNY